MKKVKKILTLIMIVMISIEVIYILKECYFRATSWMIRENRPMEQSNTKWMSEDGTIVFCVDVNIGKGIINVNGQVIDILVADSTKIAMEIYPLDALDEEKNYIDGTRKYETWLCYYKSPKEFVAKVTSKTTFFKKNQKIHFYRVDEVESKSLSDW